MIKNVYVLANFEYENGEKPFTMESILGSSFVVPTQLQGTPADKLISMYESRITPERIQEILSGESFSGKLIGYKFIYKKEETKYYFGEYYAHEYDKYTRGKARRITWSNGLVEYEVKCLDKSLDVLDGFWEDLSGNGCGDTFELLQRMP